MPIVLTFNHLEKIDRDLWILFNFIFYFLKWLNGVLRLKTRLLRLSRCFLNENKWKIDFRSLKLIVEWIKFIVLDDMLLSLKQSTGCLYSLNKQNQVTRRELRIFFLLNQVHKFIFLGPRAWHYIYIYIFFDPSTFFSFFLSF